jgi:hypothetical protein
LIPTPGASEEWMATIQPQILKSSTATSPPNHGSIGNNTKKPDAEMMKIQTIWNTMIQEQRIEKDSTEGNNNISCSTNPSNDSSKIVLEGYTRDGWAWKPNVDHWTTITVLNCGSNSKKRKLYNFVQYLKERQKSAYGRFGARGIFVVSYVQQQQQQQSTSDNGDGSTDQMECRIAIDCTSVPNCSLLPLVQQRPAAAQAVPTNLRDQTFVRAQAATRPTATTTTTTSSTTNTKKGGGLLGKLVGAQQRTNEHVVASKQLQHRPSTQASIQQYIQRESTHPTLQDSNNNSNNNSMISSSSSLVMTNNDTASNLLKSAQEVIADFRQECHDQMLNFDIAEEEVLQIPIVLKDYTKHVLVWIS